MARATLFQDGVQTAERGLRVPKRVEKIEAWAKAARKCFARELGSTHHIAPSLHKITSEEIRMVFPDGVWILVRRKACPMG